ncbi:aminotransferase class IV family protein [Nitrosophilus kaiyonis]|uniref:aminotransferase class IV family protein n=1 Tax=Nitrosophilus kaiyonis TaxID=2930200 RepID=UPI002492F015|nr:aminotransferase class IV family protein [Nitrosophilus kaiyonis]
MKFFETIKIENGKIFHIDYHNKRLNKTIYENFHIKSNFNLQDYINPHESGFFRCKVIYDKDILDIRYFPYQQREIKSFKLIESNIDYDYKYLDRKKIDELFEKRDKADEIIIVKNGLITDTSIANIALFDGKKWLTPKKPLLYGTTRERLLKEKKIFEKDIKIEEIKKYKKIALMNAMIGFYIVEEGIIL